GIGLTVIKFNGNRGTIQRRHGPGQGFKLVAEEKWVVYDTRNDAVRKVRFDSVQTDALTGLSRIGYVVVYRHDRAVALLDKQRRRQRVTGGPVCKTVCCLQEVTGGEIAGRVQMACEQIARYQASGGEDVTFPSQDERVISKRRYPWQESERVSGEGDL